MSKKLLVISSTLILLLLSGCSAKDAPAALKPIPSGTDFNSYWYAGKAELCHYDLKQSRYGEIHEGEAVFIFVTEDFLVDEQVKYENGAGEKTSVLKLNAIRRFKTGLYDYSLMRSVFTPIDHESYPNTLKVSHSAQDWCGHSFTQINHRDKRFELRQFSYFQDEGDKTIDLPIAMLEDELWNRIRLDLPIAAESISLIPALDHIRMRHLDTKAYDAKLTQRADKADPERKITTVHYLDIDRNLTIVSERDFPHRILEWQETVSSGFGAKATKLTTTATLSHTRNSAYWSENSTKNSSLRKEFGLQW